MSPQPTLFDQLPILPEGLQYYANFISDAEEQSLMATVTQVDLHHMQFQGYTAKRKVASFGYDFNFSTRRLTRGKKIPDSFGWLIAKVAAHIMIDEAAIAALLVTEYPRGSVINWHRDAPPFETIVGISLGADCLFKLRPYDPLLRNKRSSIVLPVARRSLYTLQGVARTDWEHSTAPVAATRYSITLRTLA